MLGQDFTNLSSSNWPLVVVGTGIIGPQSGLAYVCGEEQLGRASRSIEFCESFLLTAKVEKASLANQPFYEVFTRAAAPLLRPD